MTRRFTQLDFPQPGQIRHWTNVHGCAASRYIADLAVSSENLIVLITKNSENAHRYEAELEFFEPTLQLHSFPDYETLPYDRFSPPISLISERISTLYRLPEVRQGVLIVPIRTLMHRMVPPDYILTRSFVLNVGDHFNLEEQSAKFSSIGYTRVDTVYEPGEYAVRGSIFDVFPIGTKRPIRVDTFDDSVDSLRYFRIDTQLSSEQSKSISILPAHEFRLDKEGIDQFRHGWHTSFDEDVRYCPDYQDVSNGVVPEGIECFLPLFFEETATFFDYINDTARFVLDTDLDVQSETFWDEITNRFEAFGYDPKRPLLPPHKLYLRPDETRQRWNIFPKIQLVNENTSQRNSDPLECTELPDLVANRRSTAPLARLCAHLQDGGRRTLFVAETNGRREFLTDFLSKSDIIPRQVTSFDDFANSATQIGLAVAPLDRSCAFGDLDLICETDLFDSHSAAVSVRARKNAIDPSLVIRNLFEIDIGTPVVHIDHGVGIYRGLTTVKFDNVENEFVTVEYENGDLLRIPVTELHLITRYIGSDEDEIRIDRLGSDRWRKVRERAERKVHDVAAELLSMFARREMNQSYAYSTIDSDYEHFCDQCAFQLTDDQEGAVTAILEDLSATKSMDRMVCGDVGFGKTEVAMRAAFHVASQGKQVFVLVPTTVLARQHFETFEDRFADWPFEIEYLTRFRTAKERDDIYARIQSGLCDIAIGTHQLLNPAIEPKELGLLIVDEEHRFGVRDKERLRTLRANVDLLTLTATPIPRTLNMTLEGLRDLSLIETAPAARLAIRTFIAEHDWEQVKDAITRELDRGGQVYYLHNRIDTIFGVADTIRELIPESRVLVAHGGMPKTQIEAAMSDFYHRRGNVLVCTTIIESGIDVPNANTIVIERADSLGLAQLHQIRGRVGRSHHQAYAFLTTAPELVLTNKAKRRLEAIAQADELGAGFKLALEDMQIRGAGELLGQEQSGEITDVGYDFYIRMLEETIEAMKSNRVPDLDKPFELGHDVDLKIATLIPFDYLPDVKSRLIFYKRIANALTKLEIDHLMAECVDRFGPIPDELANLFRVSKIRLDAVATGVGTVKLSHSGGYIEFVDHTLFDIEVLLGRVQSSHPREKYELTDSGKKLRIRHTYHESEQRLCYVEEFLQSISLKKQPTTKVA
ncbi:MAG: transcription-repair coupling factor [Gammaproteobacteria bacterium]|nr:transcription-repair coupling factor [Gammaproteobacteria bacterium]